MCERGRLVLPFFLVFLLNFVESVIRTPALDPKASRCYDELNRPHRCIPEFENAAFNVLMEATNTCGEDGPSEYCEQTGVGASGVRKSCELCHPNQHHPQFMTDFHSQDYPTWWQSRNMLEGVQFPNQVNLTLKFGKAFDVTYIRIWFWSPRPESFFISKRTNKNGPWIPYQYYSATCRDTYGLPDSTHTTGGDETRPFCTSEYSDISPLRGGNVAFGTLEGRPSAYYFDESADLQEWVTATDIKITLDRLNTFGDEVFGDQQVLKSYFYAIADIAVGARCKCNGHASECVVSSEADGNQVRICRCEHNTAGPDCNECLPFFNDAPWGRASAKDAHECKECNCNGYSNRCYFDQSLYEITGHGSHCLDCTANRDGANCEQCRVNYYMREDGYCVPCNCDRVGAKILQCNLDGKCQCKPGVTGEKCDRCDVNFYDLSSYGCKSCGCNEIGSANNELKCDPQTGNCFCKENVEGKRCRECKPGYFNIQQDNPFGCTPCFCYGHSSSCKSAAGYSKYSIESSFSRNEERWSAEGVYGRPSNIKYDPVTQSVGVKSTGEDNIYFVAPQKFLGDQRASYNQLLEFVLRIGDNGPIPSPTDIIVEGNGQSITNTIFSQQNKLPSEQDQKFAFRLHEYSDYGWQPTLTSRNFLSVLTNITAIKIKGTYSPAGTGFLDDFKLGSAIKGVAGEPAHWIETCDCPTGYVGQFCESCAPGFRHFPAFDDAFLPCVPCDCNNHASICESETGKCICQHNTAGENCQFCTKGFYGNALKGTINDCQPCDCPNGGPCIQIDENTIMCTECPLGYAGHRCDFCSDGYYGDPTGKFGTIIPCKPCDCNKNIDPNAIGNCNTTTGECLKCIFSTAGPNCEVCLPGFYGNALELPKGDCKRCECHLLGSVKDFSGAAICDQMTGICQCKPAVVGRNCDKCEDGYFNLHSGNGCQSCSCDPVGSVNQTCNVLTGQCYCKPGVTGLRCNRCESKQYGFSVEGCKECSCDPAGSKHLQCDNTGQCLCLENVEGKKCDRCKENKFNKQVGCVDCPDCYKLIQNSVKTHNNKLFRLKEILDEIEYQPAVIPDEEFPNKLHNVEEQISTLHKNVTKAMEVDGPLLKLIDVDERTGPIKNVLVKVHRNIDSIFTNILLTKTNIQNAEELLDESNEKLQEIQDDFFNTGVKSLNNALVRAELAGEHSEKMTIISHEARDLANTLDDQAKNIVTINQKTKTDSIVAYKKAKDSVADQTQMIEIIKNLKNEIKETDKQLHSFKEWIKDVSERGQLIKKNALTLFSEAENIIVPRIALNEFKQESTDLEERANFLKNEYNILFQESIDLKNSINKQFLFGKDLLQQASDQYEEIIDLKNDLILYESGANEAIKLWNEIWTNAENNYQLLREFDSQTKKSKDEANEALRTVSEIQSIMEQTGHQARVYRDHLNQATKNAGLALQKAEQANVLAKNASIKADNVKRESELLYKNSTALVEEAGLMYDRVQNTEGELKSLIEKTKTNTSLVKEANEKVGRAVKDNEEVSNKVHQLLSAIENIMFELQSSSGINESDVDRLEEQIKLTEEKIRRAKLDERLTELQEEKKLQDEMIEKYKSQIALLQGEVDNIERIVEGLPSGCYRRLELEP